MKYSQKVYEGALASLAKLREQSTSDSERATIDFIAEAVAEKADRDVSDPTPLTHEQLRQMVGSWVWVVVNYENAEASYKCDGWALVPTPGIVAYLDQEFSTSEVGTRFRAYAHPVSNFGTRIVSRKDSEEHAKPE